MIKTKFRDCLRCWERGQSLPIAAAILMGLLVLAGLVADGGLYYADWQGQQVDLDAACAAAGDGGGYTAFTASLQANDVPAEFYEPYRVGPDGWPIAGMAYSGRTIYSGLTGPHTFYLAQLFGIHYMDVAVRTRCRVRYVGMSPIAVQEPWYQGEDPSFPDDVFPILGDGAAAVDYTGNDFAGAVIPQVWCVDSSGTPDTNCSEPQFFDPLTDSPTANQLKGVVSNTIAGMASMPIAPIGMHLPQISGVSNSFLVGAMDDRYDVGDRIVVMVYPGTLYKPDPGYGNWDNVEIIYYALAEITDFDSNTMWVRFVGGPYDSPIDIDGVRSRVIPWDWGGAQ